MYSKQTLFLKHLYLLLSFNRNKLVPQNINLFGERFIKVPDAKGKKLVEGGYVGKEVILGIRPEDVHDEEVYINNSPDSIIDVTIRVYEMLGAEVFLYFDIEEVSCTARVNPRTTARPGDTVKLALDLTKLHVFDKETEQVITN